MNKVYHPGSPEYRMYRESAFNYSFQGDRIEVSGSYLNFEEGNTILEDKELWEDFARTSRFQNFYKKHHQLYKKEIDLAEKLLPVTQMWQWCEQKFPARYHTYRVVISPLVNGFHSTQHIIGEDFNECIMFLCGLSTLGNQISKIDLEVSYSGLLLTEIDHNYINPVSDLYKEQLNNIFGRDIWIREGTQAEGYGSGMAYFNEYMTHAVYLLYVKDYYPEALERAINERSSLMEWRGFPKFREFYNKLQSLYDQDKMRNDLTLSYPELIAWASKEI